MRPSRLRCNLGRRRDCIQNLVLWHTTSLESGRGLPHSMTLRESLARGVNSACYHWDDYDYDYEGEGRDGAGPEPKNLR